jgi:tetratricopeptide (TPR) repeat protein
MTTKLPLTPFDPGVKQKRVRGIRQALVACVCAVLPLAAGAQSKPEMPDMPGMEHHHMEESVSTEKLGLVHFPVSCAAQSQVPFERGVALLHSFGYTLAEQQFRSIAESDPKCAMAHWGIAMTQFKEIWDRPDADAIKTGASEMEKARALIAENGKITAREQAYIDALGTFFSIAPLGFQQARDAYAASMEGLHAAYPEDIEGSAFYALSLLADVAPDDTSLTKERKALSVLVPLFHANPNHPGLAHYIIHTCDTPALASQGLEAALVYAKIAPSSPHALHMPGHIFARLGMWPEDISSNLASVAASKKDEEEHQPGAAHQLHADEFLVYAWLQTGQDEKARQLTDQFESIAEQMEAMPGMDDMKHSGAGRDNRLQAVYLTEMHDWKALAALTPAPGTAEKGFSAFAVFWGQGVAAGHMKDEKLATAALAGYDAVLERLKKSPYADSADDAQIQRNEILGWKAYAEGDSEAAIEAMRKAADQQDKAGQNEVDIPAREMLADLLMALNRTEEALTEYKAALKLSPNRLNGLLGAGAAAEAMGDQAQAVQFYKQIAHNTDNGAETARAWVKHAVEFNAAHMNVASGAGL